jgi:hypothetical protein
MFHVNPPQILAIANEHLSWSVKIDYIKFPRKHSKIIRDRYVVRVGEANSYGSLLQLINRQLYKTGKRAVRVVEEIVNDTL